MSIYWRASMSIFAVCMAIYVNAIFSTTAQAHHLLPQHTLNCSQDFPCPDEIKGRIHFWIEVFRTWDKQTAVLHDSRKPERVYAVLRSKNCNRSVRKKRERVKAELRALATKIETGGRLTAADQHFAELFLKESPREIRQASENIRCQRGVRDDFLRGFQRYTLYRPMVDKYLKKYNLPADIRYLPFVESSYNPAAYSKVGAVGMWQLMPKTAQVLGLKINPTLDERMEPEAATRVAALYLKNARKKLTKLATAKKPSITTAEINPFVITSYIYGVYGMERAIRQVGPDFIAVLEHYKSPTFGVAVKNFYPSFLAARHVAINAEQYFGKLPPSNHHVPQIMVLQHSTSAERIKKVFGLSEDKLSPLNLSLTRFVWRGWRLIPKGYHLHLPHNAGNWRSERRQLASLTPERAVTGGDRYTVRRGDTACQIADVLNVSCRDLISVNRLGRKAVIQIGQNLLIPGPIIVNSSSDIAYDKQNSTTYHVRKGDTACGIALLFRVNCQFLIRHNQLGYKAKIYTGQPLSIPGKLTNVGIPRLHTGNHYIVRNGDSACAIAQRFSIKCADFRRINSLHAKAIIHPGQKLKISSLAVKTTKTDEVHGKRGFTTNTATE